MPESGSERSARDPQEAGERDGATLADVVVDARGQECTEEAAAGTDAQGEADLPLAEPEVAQAVEDQQGAGHRVEQVVGAGAHGDPPQQRVGEDEGQSLADLGDEPAPVVSCRRHLLVADPVHEERRPQEAQCIEPDGQRRADQLDQATGDRRSSDHRDGLRRLQLGIALADVLGLDDLGQVALVGHVEEDRARADHHGHHEHLPERQCAHRPRHRQRGQGGGAHQVAPDQDVLLVPTVDPGPGRPPR